MIDYPFHWDFLPFFICKYRVVIPTGIPIHRETKLRTGLTIPIQCRVPVPIVLAMPRKFQRLGIGKKTEWGVVITQGLIDITKKRLEQLTIRKINL